ncbi:MAG: hypothetical protein M3P42_10015 [Actinomycetota bacterium]|nr:hypothetical protein [Actinomycetota bacterium]
MMRLPVIFLVGLAVLALVASANAASSYCSPTGDYCTSTQRQSGAVYLRLSSFNNIGAIRICVTDPKKTRVCRTFALTKRGEMWQVNVRWRSRYPSAGPGRYLVGFFLGQTRLGPLLDFRIR